MNTERGPELENDLDELDSLAETAGGGTSTMPTPAAGDDDADASTATADLDELDDLDGDDDNADTSAEPAADADVSEAIDPDDIDDDEDQPILSADEQSELDELKQLVNEYRAKHDVPPSPDDYEVPQIKGYAFDHSAPMVQELFSVAHSNGVTKKAVSEILTWFGGKMGSLDTLLKQKDAQDVKATAPELQREWGANYKANLDLVRTLFRDERLVPIDARNAIENARLPDGRRLVNDRGFLRYLAQSARAQVADPKTSADLRLAEIDKVLQEDVSEYYRQGLDRERMEITTSRSSEPRSVSNDARRIKEIERIMATDMNRYWRENLADEYGALLARAEG